MYVDAADRISTDQSAEFEAAYGRAGAVLDADEHCLGWEIARCIEHDDRYVIRIHWDSIDGHLKGFRTSPEFQEFLGHVRPYIDSIEEMTHYDALVPARGEGTSIYQHAGGADALRRLMHVFYAKVKRDPLLEPLFGNMSPDHPDHVADWLGEVFGGPRTYTQMRGGYSNMVLAHINRDISEEQRTRWMELLFGSLDEAGLPDDDRFRRTFRSYIEWGTGIALRNSKPDFTPPRHASVPTWPWAHVDGG